MSNNNCAICLESLCTGPIGFTHPCGHVFHRECYNSWTLSRASHISSTLNNRNRPDYYNANADADRIQIKCPMCSRPVCATDGFTHVFLDLSNGDDDVSVSDDDDDDDDESDIHDDDVGSDDAAVGGRGRQEDNNNHNYSKDDNNDDDDHDDDDSDNDSIDLTNTKESCDAIVIGDSDDDDDEDFTIMPPPSTCTSIPTSTSTPTRTQSTCTNSSSSNSTRSSSVITNNGNSSTVGPGPANNDEVDTNTNTKTMKKKYKKVKRQLKLVKETAKKYQELKAQSDQWKEMEQDLREELTDMSQRESRYKRDLQQCKDLLDSTLVQVVTLENELKTTQDSYHSKVRALEQDLQKSKASSIEEIKEIMSRDKELVKKYDQLLNMAREKDMELQQLEKQNASLKRRLMMGTSSSGSHLEHDSYSNSSAYNNTIEGNVGKPKSSKSKSQLIDAMKSIRREIDHDEVSAEEQREAIIRRDAQRGMMKKSSKQTMKIVKATNKALQKRTSRPKFSMAMGGASTSAGTNAASTRSSRDSRTTSTKPRLSHSGQAKSGLAEARVSSYIPRLGVKRSDMRSFVTKKK